MRTLILFVVFISALSITNAQNFQKIDEEVRSYPDSYSNIDKLANKINQDFKTTEEKVRAIYTWIALHINYDVKTYLKGTKPIKYTFRNEEEKLQKETEIEDKLAKQTLKTQKAVCHGYATLFKTLCELSGIKSVLITGTSKTSTSDIGKEPTRTDHAWNAVMINDEWKLIDVTWGAGYLNGQNMRFIKEYSDAYFFTEPEKFFYNHFPKDNRWLLTSKDSKDFAHLPLFYRTYLSSGIDIIKPNKGIIKAKRGGTFEFVLRNNGTKPIGYKFSNEKIGNEIEPVVKGNLSYYKINVGSGSYLTIYLNQNALVSYKIQ